MNDHRTHAYHVRVNWTGNTGEGTASYASYLRDHEITVPGKPIITGSSDPSFRGDPLRYNPEELLVAALSGCHMLWYLHLCANAGIVVTGYTDDASGTITEGQDGGGCFQEVILRPSVTIAEGADETLAIELHDRAHRLCFVAASVKFPVRCEPRLCRMPTGGEPSRPGSDGPPDTREVGSRFR